MKTKISYLDEMDFMNVLYSIKHAVTSMKGLEEGEEPINILVGIAEKIEDHIFKDKELKLTLVENANLFASMTLFLEELKDFLKDSEGIEKELSIKSLEGTINKLFDNKEVYN